MFQLLHANNISQLVVIPSATVVITSTTNYVTFHLSQLLPQVDLIHTCDNNICHKGINGHIPHGNNICQTLVVNMKIDNNICHNLNTCWLNICQHNTSWLKHQSTQQQIWYTFKKFKKKFKNIIKYNIPETPSTMGVFGSITFSHTPEEAMSGGLAKACVPTKN